MTETAREVASTVRTGKCTRLPVLTVVKNQKFLSSLTESDLSTAGTASRSTDLRGSKKRERGLSDFSF